MGFLAVSKVETRRKDPAEIASFFIILSPSESEKRLLTWLIFHQKQIYEYYFYFFENNVSAF